MKCSDIPFLATVPPEPAAPPLRDLWGPSQARAAFLQFHVEARFFGSLEYMMFHVLKFAPPDWASGFGAAQSPFARFLNRHQPWVAEMRRSAATLNPALAGDDAGLDAFIAAWFRHSGRTHAEYPVSERMSGPRHLSITWDDAGHALAASSRPLIITICHLGTWERVYTPLVTRFERSDSVFAIYEPQENRFRNRMVAAVRRRRNTPCLPPGPVARRLLPKLLGEGRQSIIQHIDENVGDTVGFPLFGREPPTRANVLRAIKASRIYDAPILPLLTWREGASRQRLHMHAPIEPPSRDKKAVTQVVAQLNAIYEPAVRAHLDQWFMLPWLKL